MTIEEILGRLDEVRSSGSNHTARCPAHDDQRSSLSVSSGEDDRVLVRCHAGCSFEQIVSAMGLEARDFFPGEANPTGPANSAVYSYRDEEGGLLFQVVRRPDKSFVQRRSNGNGAWTYSLADVRRVLYHLPELVAQAQRAILVPEGEKDVDALRALDFLATCNPGGAGSWKLEYNDFFKDRHVILLPDNDLPGRKHVLQVVKNLAGVASNVRVLELPGLPPKGDVSDWLRAGGDAERLKVLARTAPSGDVWLANHPELNDGDAPAEVSELEWEPLASFDSPKLPSFPAELLPEPLGPFVEAVAVALQVPVDLPGMFVLATLAVACARRMVVRVTEGYTEPLNLFVACVLDPANRKSPTVRLVMKPIESFERELCDQMRETVAQEAAEYKTLRRTLESVQKRAASSKDTDERQALMADIRNLAVELDNRKEPALPRLLADDATPEKLASLLAEQGGRMAILSSEGGVFDIISGRYSNNVPNLDLYLKAWGGDGVRIDRINRAAERIEEPALTLGLALQLEVLRTIVSRPGLRGRGLLGRFLYAIPASPLGRRIADPPPVPALLERGYNATLTTLLRNDATLQEPREIELSSEALNVWQEFFAQLEPRLGEDGDLSSINDWAGKLPGAVVRIAGLLHAARHPVEPWASKVSQGTMSRATELGRYLIDHGRGAYATMGADPEIEDARRVLRWIKRKEVASFSQRDCFEGVKGHFERVDRLLPALSLLKEHGYIRLQPPARRRGPGRPRGPIYEVHPDVGEAERNSQNAQNALPPPGSANSATPDEDEGMEEVLV